MREAELKELRDHIADMLVFHVGTPIDSYGTTRKQPDWCCSATCRIHNNQCEFCIATQIMTLIEKEAHDKI